MPVLVLQSFLLILSPAFCNKIERTHHSALHPVGGQLLKKIIDHFETLKMFLSWSEGVHWNQWLSGRMFDSRSEGCVFEPHWKHCVFCPAINTIQRMQ